MSKLKEVEENIKETINKIISDKLGEATKESDNWKVLVSYLPHMSEIKFMAGWSGWCDGDTEYPIASPLLSSTKWMSSLGDEDDEEENEWWKSQNSGEGYELDWSEDTDHDKMIKKFILSLSKTDADKFSTAYESLVEEIFKVVGSYYEYNDLIVIKV